jgi:flagellar basal-body rod protein FlgB
MFFIRLCVFLLVCTICLPALAEQARINVIDAMKAQMDYANQRQVVLNNNIANVDTPGYKGKDLAPPNYKKLMRSHRLAMVVTSPQHIQHAKQGGINFRSITDKDTLETSPTGNNVVIEDQIRKADGNSTDYRMTTELYKKMGSLLKTSLGSK